MSRFRLSPEAAQDIRQIWTFIAEDSLLAATRVRRQIQEACSTLAKHPRMGHRRTDLTREPVLFWTTGAFLIVYSPERPIAIVRVLHASRDVRNILGSGRQEERSETG